MKTNAVQQEILILKNTSFAQRELLEEETPEPGRNLTDDEQLEAACWNGWLKASLPEMLNTSTTGEQLYLWEIVQSKSFLNIALCEYPQTLDPQYSINPYVVITTACYE